MRVGADGGIGVKYMARADAKVIGMLGSGGMSRTHMDAFMHVRPGLKKLQVFSPTKANREQFGREMAEKFGLEVVVCDNPRDIYKGADIVAAVTDSAVPVLNGDWIEPGQHIVSIGGGGGLPDQASLDKVDVYFRFGNAPAPQGLPHLTLADEYLTYAARPNADTGHKMKRRGKRGHGEALPERMVSFKDLHRRPQFRPLVGEPDHLLGARQPAGQPVLGGRRRHLRESQGRRPRPRDPDRVVPAGHPGLIGMTGQGGDEEHAPSSAPRLDARWHEA